MTTKPSLRNLAQKEAIPRVAPSASPANPVELDNIIQAIGKQITPNLELKKAAASYVIEIGPMTVTDSETGFKKVLPPLKGAIPNFTSATITIPSVNAGNVTTSAGAATQTVSITSGSFKKLGVFLDNAGSILFSIGAEGASVDAAGVPPSVSNSYALGYVVLTNNAGTIVEPVQADIYQYGASGSGSGSGFSSTYQNSAYSVQSGDEVIADTSGSAFTITMPAAPQDGDRFRVIDVEGTFGTNNVTIARNGKTIQGVADDLLLDLDNLWIEFVYSSTADDWRIVGPNQSETYVLASSSQNGLVSIVSQQFSGDKEFLGAIKPTGGFDTTGDVGLATSAQAGLVKMNSGATTGNVAEYSEGTWTPSQAGVSNLSGAPSFGTATYTKIGRVVYAQISEITGALVTTSGDTTRYMMTTTGLPGITNTTIFTGSAYTSTTSGPVTASIYGESTGHTHVTLTWDANASASAQIIKSIGFWYFAQ